MTQLIEDIPTDVPAQNDSKLIELSRNGDRDAFRQLVEHNQGLICAIAFSACGDAARSEDLANETFLAAWQSLGRLQDPAKFKPAV